MATSRIPYDKMGGYKLIEWNDTTPDTVNTEYRQSIPGASSSGYAACVGVMVMNKSNNAWYQLPQAGWMNGGLLRFTISDPVYAGQPFHAVILSK